jgi:predicted TIM-barrel fold metal-dependent hydrolase
MTKMIVVRALLVSIAALVAITAVSAPIVRGQEPPLDGREGRMLALPNFRPRSMLQVASHPVTQAKFPVVDVHTHFRVRLHHSPEALDDFVRLMDRRNIAVCASLDGQLGDALEEHQQYLWTKHRDRFVFFANLDWRGGGAVDDPATWDMHRPDFARRMATQLAQAKEQGASGLKIFKQFGLELKNPDGSLTAIDDVRWDPIWQACGELGLPVLVHTADPAAFFLPIDETNERWEELHRRPEWSFYGPQFPRREDLLAALLRVVERHPQTVFIAAHVGNYAEDLSPVREWLARYPNLYVDISSRISELGRQPYTARKFFLDYADRILFATDGPWPDERIGLYWRFLETFDENFPYSEKEFPPQGFWNIYGVGLPDDVLKKVYQENAARLIPGVKERLKKFAAARSNNATAP